MVTKTMPLVVPVSDDAGGPGQFLSGAARSSAAVMKRPAVKRSAAGPGGLFSSCCRRAGCGKCRDGYLLGG